MAGPDDEVDESDEIDPWEEEDAEDELSDDDYEKKREGDY